MYSTQGARLTTRFFASLTIAAGVFVGGCSDPATSVVEPKLASQIQGAELLSSGLSSLQAQTTLAIGASVKMQLSSPFVSWRRNVYRSRNANVATVSTSGLITGISNGRTYVTVLYNANFDSSLVVVGTGLALSVQPSTATVPLGTTLQLTTNGGAGITYSSDEPSNATVSSTGVVTGVGAGSTVISAHATGVNAIMSVTVPMSFTTPSLSVIAGSTAQIALGALSLPCANGTRTYTVAAPAVATVSAAGVVTGVATGATTVTVNAGVCSGTLPVAVTAGTATTPPPVPPTAVAVNLVRFAGLAGAVTFSNGIPLPLGTLRSTQLNNVRLFLAGTEQPLFVKALGGLHKDGSLHSIQIQGRVVAPSAGSVIQGYLSFDTPRVAGSLTQVANPTTLEAAVLPTSPAYLVSTEAGGKMLVAADVAAGTANMRAHDVDFETMAPQLDLKYLNQWARDQTLYDHVMTTYQHYMQTADPKWFAMAWNMGNAYQRYFITGGVQTEWASNTESLVVHYWMTGDESTRGLVGRFTEWWTGAMNFYGFSLRDGYMRVKGRAMLAQLDCVKIECNPGVDKYHNPYTTPYDLKTILPSELNQAFTLQVSSGLFPGDTLYAGGQKNFMVGIFLTAMTRYYDEYNADSRILPFVKKSLDYMMTSEWDVATQGFRYCTTTAGDCNTVPQPGLNNLILPGYAWYFNTTRDPKYLGYADQLFAGNRSTRVYWLGYVKQFDQAMYRIVNYYYWRK